MAYPRKPNALKELEGTDRADRHRDEIPLAEAADTAPPPNLLNNPEALRLWGEYAPALVACGVLANADKNALAMACNLGAILYDQMRGGDMPNASIFSQYRMMLNEFGLTPSSRAKPVPVGAKGKKDPTEEFFGPRKAG